MRAISQEDIQHGQHPSSAALRPGQDYKIETIDIEGRPRDADPDKATGLCHSDEHARTGDMPMPHYPIICGMRAQRCARGRRRVTTLRP